MMNFSLSSFYNHGVGLTAYGRWAFAHKRDFSITKAMKLDNNVPFTVVHCLGFLLLVLWTSY